MQLKSIEQSFSVNFDYKLHFTEGVFKTKNTLLKTIVQQYSTDGPVKMLFVIDMGVQQSHSQLLNSIKDYCKTYSNILNYTDSLIIQGGELAKNEYENVTTLLAAINNYGICRHSFVVVIGGGAVIDMAGYAAAIAHRGVQLIRIPTTVLAQDDAGIGVKNGINGFDKKNFIGTFSPPYAIINDCDFLTTLDQRDWIAGVAEAVKVALIKDAAFFNYIEENTGLLKDRNMATMQYVIYRCAEIHMQHIGTGGDPFESGSSRPLDFGHWAAHKLEQMTQYALRHGEAVAMGMAIDVTYAHLIGLISKTTYDRVIQLIKALGFTLHIPVQTAKDHNQLLNGIQEFREHLGGKLTITLLKEIGKKYDVHVIDLRIMKKAIKALNNANPRKEP